MNAIGADGPGAAKPNLQIISVFLQEFIRSRVDTLEYVWMPEQLRSEGYLDHLTAESRARVTSVALGLVIPDWRMVAVKGGP